MDRVEQQGADLWQKIIEKRAAAGLGKAPEEGSEKEKGKGKEYHCPNCMAALKEPVSICPHCGKSTEKSKIIPPAEAPDEGPAAGLKELNLPPSAKGLGTIKGAGERARLLKHRHQIKLDVIIAIVIFLILVAAGYLIARQTGLLPPSLDFFKSETTQHQAAPAALPDILGITVSDIGSTGATIAWSTSVKSSGNVLYGKTDSYGLSAAAESNQLTQQVKLTGLEPGVSYHFAVIATDNTSKELARSEDRIFTTVAVHNPEPPVVTTYKVIPTDVSAFIHWTTDEPSTSQVLYGLDQQCSNSSSLDSRMVREHSIRLSGLEPDRAYYYRIKSANAAGVATLMDPPDIFKTLINVPSGSNIGERASDFTLPVFQSQDSISLRSFKGQKVLLTFWAVHCPECDRELALLQSLKDKNIPDVNIISIFLESKPEDIEKTINAYEAERGELTVPVVVDMYKTTSHLYNVEKLPCTFFIDSDGIIRDIEYGSFNIDQVEQALKNL